MLRKDVLTTLRWAKGPMKACSSRGKVLKRCTYRTQHPISTVVVWMERTDYLLQSTKRWKVQQA